MGHRHSVTEAPLANAPSATGVLACLDGYMNIAMEQTEEYVNGQLKAKYGDTFIRGNNGEGWPSGIPVTCLMPRDTQSSRSMFLPCAVLYISTQKKS